MRRWGWLVVVGAIVGSCSSSGADDASDSSSEAPATTTSLPDTSAAAPSTTAPSTTAPPTTVASSTTTTTMAPNAGPVTVEGPITSGAGKVALGSGVVDLAALGYVQEEYFVSGTASAYRSGAALTADGRWSVEPYAPEPYTTRIIVRRPSDPAKFSGDVAVEWLNVSAGFDSSPDWSITQAELTRTGWAWVGVSAQQTGIEGREGSLAPLAPKQADPERYAPLSHPGDSYSYDLFSQVGAAVRTQATTVLGGSEPTHVYAFGESQSAFRMTTYVNAVAPVAHVFDGYLIHSRAGYAASLTQEPLDKVDPPDPVRIRDDLDVPVFQFQTETDVAGVLRFAPARQPDTDLIRTWEVPGTAHADAYTLGISDTDDGTGAADAAMFAALLNPPSGIYGGLISCDRPINAGPQTYVLRSAVAALRSWVREGTAPPSFPPLELDTDGALVLDDRGNARGGVRTPHVDAPVAALSGLGQTGSGFCGLFGTTVSLRIDEVVDRYGGWATFLKAWQDAIDAAVQTGALLDEDGQRLSRAANGYEVG